jgi:hypothetical protein
VFIQDLLDLPKYQSEVTTSTGNQVEAHGLVRKVELMGDEYTNEYPYRLSPLGEYFCKAIEILNA